MQWIDWIVVAIIALIVGGALAYIIKAKKSGKRCIGCPDSGSCCAGKTNAGGGCKGCNGACHCHEENE